MKYYFISLVMGMALTIATVEVFHFSNIYGIVL